MLYQNISNQLDTITEIELYSSADEEDHVEEEHPPFPHNEGEQIYQTQSHSAQKEVA